MKTLMKIIFGLAAVFILCAGFIYANVYYSGIPSKGGKIARYENPRKALFVIDMQEDYSGVLSKKYPAEKAESAIKKINELIKSAADKKYEVIYIRQEFSSAYDKFLSKMFMDSSAIKGMPGTEIDKRIKIVSSNVFNKSVGDAFSNHELDRFMISNKIDEVFLTGLDAEYCVHSTAKGALNRAYKGNIISDAILLKSENKFDDLMKQYKNEGISVIKRNEF
jgi:nicotinamidase/pyrazinamidase